MTRPRIVHVVVAGEIGGAERMLAALAASDDATSADHVIALLTPNERLANLFCDAGLRVHDRGRVREGVLPFLWQALGPRDANWISRVLVAERADVVHLHTFGSQVVGTRAALRQGSRIVRTEHSTRAFVDPSCWPFSQWSLARTDASVAISEHVRSVALARAPWAAGKIQVVANGVDVDRFAPRPEPKAHPFRFVLVGRLETRKGIDLAVDALARVPDAHLDVVGDGAELKSLVRRSEARGIADRVRFHGYLGDPREIVASAHAALCSSRAEGLGVALLEAMAMARPVVGFAVGGVPEIVADGRTGLLAPPGDVDGLAARMREATASVDRLRAFGKAARARVVERFSMAAMCAAYARVYQSLAGAPRSDRISGEASHLGSVARTAGRE